MSHNKQGAFHQEVIDLLISVFYFFIFLFFFIDQLHYSGTQCSSSCSWWFGKGMIMGYIEMDKMSMGETGGKYDNVNNKSFFIFINIGQ